MNELKHIDFESGVIPVGEKKLLIKKSLSVEKWIEYEKLMVTFSFGKDLEAINSDLLHAWNYLNSLKLAEAAVLINNLREGIVRNLEKRTHPALELCWLFCVYENEDIEKYNPDLNQLKLKDIEQEGYDMADFFTLAANLVKGYIRVYEEISRDISNQLKDLQNQSILNESLKS
jgi:hypothetical protein